MQSELDALELLFSVDDIDQEDAIMSDARFDYGRPCKHNSITAWIMGFIDEYISYYHECDYPT